jgi:hypothetical protein
MTDADFVKKMQDMLKNQLHQEEMCKVEGPNNWNELKKHVSNTLDAINKGLSKPSVTYSQDQNLPAFTIANRLSGKGVTATFNPASGTISYAGVTSGSFIPRASGDALRFFSKQSDSDMIGPMVTIERMANGLIQSVVTDPRS